MNSSKEILFTAIILFSIATVNSVYAQPSMLTYTVNLTSYTLQISYPPEATPGDTVSVNVQGTPRNSGIYLQTLTATVYYADGNGLHTVATQTLVSNPATNYQSYGTGSFSKSFTVTIPQNATRTSLVAVFSETVQSNYYPTSYFYGPYSYSLFWGFQFAWYPSYYYGATTDAGMAPLTYIKATTPEYLALRAQYETVQQQLNQTQTQNEQLQTTISQQNSTITGLNQQLASANGRAQGYETLALILGIVAIAFAALNAALVIRQKKSESTAKPESHQ